MSTSPDGLPVECFADAAAWEAWLSAHAGERGLWLMIAKKGAPHRSVTYAEALDVALCHGWIDGQKRGFDAHHFLQRFTPRRPGSLWSQVNAAHVERLSAEGRMRAAGLREVEAAQADGRWRAAYAPARSMEPPPELQAALDASPRARAFFDSLDRTNRYAVCWRVQTAKTPATRRARIEKLVAMLERGETIHPARKG